MADTEDLVLSISADTRQMKRALDRLIGDTAKTTGAIEKQFDAVGNVGTNAFNKIAANSNKAAASQAKFGQAMKQSSIQTGNLAAQINDIGVQLAGGQSPFLIALQQGSQINQVLGQGGARAAVSALGGAFASLVNPVSLATIAIISLGGAAIQYFTEFLGSSKESEKTLKEQADLIDKVAKKWGVATPALKAYVDELARAADQKDLEDATKIIQIKAFDDLKGAIGDFRAQLAALQLQVDDTTFSPVQKAFENLDAKVKDGSASIADLKKLQFELRAAFIDSGVPAAEDFAKAIGNIATRFEKMAEAAAKAGQEARNALKREDQSFFDPRDPRFNNGVLPQTVPAPSLLGVDDIGNNPAIRGFQENLDDAASAIEGFVDRVDRAEGTGKNPNSSASGTGQFIESTWLSLFRKYYPEQAAGMGRAAILELRKDSDIARDLIKKYATENARVLQAAGVHVDEAALQLAHFLGAGDAAKVLSAAPGTPLAGLISQASINANPTILGGNRTVDDARAYAERRAGAEGYAKANEQVAASLDKVDTASKGAQASTQELQTAYVDLGQIAETALTGLANALSDGKIEGKELLQIAIQIVEQFLKAQIAGRGIGGLFGGSGGLLGGSIIPGILHSGGIAGKDGYGHGRKVQASAFVGAPRYHQGGIAGLRPNEVPAILQKGERIIPKGGYGGRDGGTGGTVTLYVKGEEGPMFRPTIQAESQGVAVKVVQAGITKYDKRLDRTLGGKMANAQARTL